MEGPIRGSLKVKTNFFNCIISLDKNSKILNFKINWNNRLKNKLWQVRLNLPKPVTETFSEDMDEIIKRSFNPDYDMRKNLPKNRGIEAKTNFAPFERLVWTQNLGVITKGLTEYEVYKNTLNITLLRSIGIISNPKNPARSTPAGPPIEVKSAQLSGENEVEFYIGNFDITECQNQIREVYPELI